MKREYTGIGVIGCGRAGMIHARNFARLVPGAKVAAVADAAEGNRLEAARELGGVSAYADYRELLADPEVHAVVIAAPTALHQTIAEAAAAGGRHIFCEKPMAMATAGCDAMIAAADAAGVVLQIGFMRRFDASFLAAKARVEAGEIGEVVLVKSCTHGPSYPQPWMFDLAQSKPLWPLAIVGCCLAPSDNVGYYIPLRHKVGTEHNAYSSLNPYLCDIE